MTTATANTNATKQKCTFTADCALRSDHMGECRPAAQIAVTWRHPAINAVLDWLPEWGIAFLFLFVAAITQGWFSGVCLLISLIPLSLIVVQRLVNRRRTERVQRERKQLPAAKAQKNGNDQ